MIIGFLKYRTPRPPRRQRRRAFMSVTQLEMRLAPATLVGTTTVTYLDEHDQQVAVQITPGVFDSSSINNVFTFKDIPHTSEQQLQEIDLTQLADPGAASGASLTITVTSPGTAQPIEVGLINAPGIDLDAVTVQGDLGAINAGAADTNPGLASLTVESMGQYGTATQPPGGSLVSTIQGSLGALTVSVPKGSVGTGNIDGEFINVNGTIGPVTVTGSLVGGAADYSGEISASGDVGGVTVGGSLEGGAGFGSGEIYTGGNLGQVTIGGSVVGSLGNASGSIIAYGNLTGVKVAGSVDGGTGDYSGEIGSDVLATGNVGPVQIGGNVVGSGGSFSGTIYAGGTLAGATVGGALDGGAGSPSGAIYAIGNITGQVQIGKGVLGSSGLYYSGSIIADGTLAGVTVGSALTGGTGDYSGVIVATGDLGQVTIGGNLQGAGGEFSGVIGSFSGNVAGVTVNGSLGVVGGAGGDSGEIFADSGVLGPVKITGNLQGYSVSGRQFLADSGFIFGARITSVTITGSVISGQNTGSGRLTNSGAIRATYDIGAITVGGLVGNKTNPVVISARGQDPSTLSSGSTTDVAIASITVGSSKVSGSVSFTNILAGYNPAGTGVNAAAQIGAVTVYGNWTASNLVAGAGPGPDGQFGTADDVALVPTDAPDAISQIGAIIITGTVSGNSANTAAHYGFVAQEVTSLTVDGKVIKLTPGPNNDHLVPADSTGTVTVNEV